MSLFSLYASTSCVLILIGNTPWSATIIVLPNFHPTTFTIFFVLMWSGNKMEISPSATGRIEPWQTQPQQPATRSPIARFGSSFLSSGLVQKSEYRAARFVKGPTSVCPFLHRSMDSSCQTCPSSSELSSTRGGRYQPIFLNLY